MIGGHLNSVIHTPEEEVITGRLPDEWLDSYSRSKHSNLASVERAQRRVITIRQELKRREQERKEQAEAERENTRNALQRVLTEAPAKAKTLEKQAPEVVAASERVRQFVADLRLMAGSQDMAGQFETLRRSVDAAANALEKKAPKMPEAPEGLPGKGEVSDILSALQGRGGFSRVTPTPGEAAKGEDLARKLK